MPVGDEDEQPPGDPTVTSLAAAVDPTGTTLAGVVAAGALGVLVRGGRRVARAARRGRRVR